MKTQTQEDYSAAAGLLHSSTSQSAEKEKLDHADFPGSQAKDAWVGLVSPSWTACDGQLAPSRDVQY